MAGTPPSEREKIAEAAQHHLGCDGGENHPHEALEGKQAPTFEHTDEVHRKE